MTEGNKPTYFNSVLIIDKEDVDLFICSRMLVITKVVNNIYTRKTIDSAIEFIVALESPVDIIIIDFISPNNELVEFLEKLNSLSLESIKNTKIIILSAVADYFLKEVAEALKFKNVVMVLNKPISETNIEKIINLNDSTESI